MATKENWVKQHVNTQTHRTHGTIWSQFTYYKRKPYVIQRNTLYMKISKHALCSLVKKIILYNSIKVVFNIHLSTCITYVTRSVIQQCTVLTSPLSVRRHYLKDTCISFSISIKDKLAAEDKKGPGGSVS
jgi:hypothetical protein